MPLAENKDCKAYFREEYPEAFKEGRKTVTTLSILVSSGLRGADIGSFRRMGG